MTRLHTRERRPGYALDAFRWACGSGIVAGNGNGQLSPDDSLRREPLAVMLYRYSQLPKVQPIETEESVEDGTAAAGA